MGMVEIFLTAIDSRLAYGASFVLLVIIEFIKIVFHYRHLYIAQIILLL